MYMLARILLVLSLLLFGPIPTRSTEEPSLPDSLTEPVDRDYDNIPPIFLLNLDRAPDRWIAAQKEMTKHGIKAHRLPAVDGKGLSKKELAMNSTKLASRLIPRGVIGCYLSHRRFWQFVVDSGLQRAIVFEDDIKIVSGFKQKLSQNIQMVDDQIRINPEVDFDVLLLGAIGRVHPEDGDGFTHKLFSSYVGGLRPLKILLKYDNVTYYQPRRPAGTHAYMVSNAGARKLLSLCPKAVFHVDLDAWRHKDLVVRIFSPMLVYQTFADTTLSDVESRDAVAKYVKRSKMYKKFEMLMMDPYTHQTLQHMLDEPILQLGPGGLIITVERHIKFIGWGFLLSAALQLLGYRRLMRASIGVTLGFVASVKTLVWILMNWK